MSARQNPHRETFPERLFLQTPAGLTRALNKVAAKQNTTMSELVRRALMREVEAHGVQLESRAS
jgi:hypothetical protein